MAAMYSIENSYFHSISTHFNEPQNLVRDQGVGGSNPLSLTNNINNLQEIQPDPLVLAEVLQCQKAHLC